MLDFSLAATDSGLLYTSVFYFNPSSLKGAAAEEVEIRKHKMNDPKCLELGLVYTAYPNYLYNYVH